MKKIVVILTLYACCHVPVSTLGQRKNFEADWSRLSLFTSPLPADSLRIPLRPDWQNSGIGSMDQEVWSTAENFEFGKDRGEIPMINDLSALHPYFRDQIYRLIDRCQKKGIELQVVESYRTRIKQAEYYSMGRKYTRSNGGKSRHQFGLAVDVVPIVNGVAVWDNKVLWRRIGIIGESLGLRWGGRWRSLYDPGHFEWTGGLTSAQLNYGLLPKVPKNYNYPCLEEDMEYLRATWATWEDQQSRSRATTASSSVPSSANH
jgi:hypothetical protein